MTTFGGINMMRTALQAQQRSLQIVGHNVANAQTDGYSRRTLALATGTPVRQMLSGGTVGFFGTGVREAEITRYRDDFLDRAFRNRSALLGQAEGFLTGVSQLEMVFNEPTEAGLRARMDDFWESVQNLNSRPGDLDTRINFRERAKSLMDHGRYIHEQLQVARQSYDTALLDKVSELNMNLKEIAQLNERISIATVSGQSPGDLLDRRDLLLDELAKFAGAHVNKNPVGDVDVWIGNEIVVSNVFASQIQVSRLPGDPISTLTWDVTGDPVKFPGGEMAALVRLRDETVPNYSTYLDTMMRELANQINAIHSTGYGLDGVTGRNLFDVGAGEMNIDVNPLIMSNPDHIAAAKAPVPPAVTVAPGDNRNIWDILQLRDAAILTGGLVGTREVTVYEYMRAMNTMLGIEANEAKRGSEAYQLQVSQTRDMRTSVSGVSHDEEMTKLIEHQQAYNAAARVVTSMDEIIETVVSRMGLVGR